MTTRVATLTARAYTIDKAHSEVTFKVRHLLTKVRGRFSDAVMSGQAAGLFDPLAHCAHGRPAAAPAGAPAPAPLAGSAP